MVSKNQLHIVAVTGFVHRDGKFLILKRSEKEIANPSEWTVPGGKVEKGSAILEILRKEIKEESGLKILDNFQFIGDSEFTRPDGYHVVVLRFLCQAKEGKVKIDKKDFTNYKWMKLEEINNYNIIPAIKREFEKIRDKKLVNDL